MSEELIEERKLKEEEIKLELKKVRQETRELKDGEYPIWKYELTVKNLNENTQENFDFYGSVSNFEKQKHPDILEAFECVLADATIFWQSSNKDELQKAYGFKESSKAEKAWKGMKKTVKKLKNLKIDEEKTIKIKEKITREIGEKINEITD
ncbi:MAG: hypothetical protein ACOCP8_05360 [archaeon]